VLEPDLRYANLAVRGKRAAQVRDEQLGPALALEPDLVSVLSGLNDVLRKTVDLDAVAAAIDTMVAAIREAGADVLLFTLPDPVRVNPIARSAAVRLVRLNGLIRQIGIRHGAFLVELDRHPVAGDPRLWDEDRLHANPEGHRRIAAAAPPPRGQPQAHRAWTAEFTDAFGRRTPASHAIWAARYFTPWLVRRLRGRSSGDGRVAKRPDLEAL
jgi:lysophospholipase L1-like esterase